MTQAATTEPRPESQGNGAGAGNPPSTAVATAAQPEPQRTPAPVPIGERGLVLRDLDSLWRFALYVAKSGLAPKGIEKPEAIFVAVQLGLELGLSPMAALQNIAVINGRPGVYGDAALAVVEASGLLAFHFEFFGNTKHRALLPSLVRTIETSDSESEADIRAKLAAIALDKKATDYGCTVVVRRKGRGLAYSDFTREDAATAGLLTKDGPWKQYPDRMLRFRARGFGLRDNFPDVLKGMRTTEELEDMPTIDAEFHEVGRPPVGRVNLGGNGSKTGQSQATEQGVQGPGFVPAGEPEAAAPQSGAVEQAGAKEPETAGAGAAQAAGGKQPNLNF